jgi:D-alanine-D-alanine ligase-like ATP-grasp enzyme
MLDENKSDIYDLLPRKFVPNTLKVVGRESVCLTDLEIEGLSFPLIVKPNIGYKGYKVIKVHDLDELQSYINDCDINREWLIQEFLDFDCEYSLLFHRIPGTDNCGISSLVEKIYPFVIGDGKSSLVELIENYENPFMDREVVRRRWKNKFETIPKTGVKIILDEIGNYARGSKFYNIGDKVDHELIAATKTYFQDVEGLDFFRLDFKADSLADYKKGAFKILEVNGAKSEPIHIYDPASTFLGNAKTIKDHWIKIREIVHARKQIGEYQFPSTRYGLRSLFAIKKLVG